MKVRKFEEKIREVEDSRWVKMYWKEKNLKRWKESYGLKKEKYYNRNGWGVIAVNRIAVKEERNLMKDEGRMKESERKGCDDTKTIERGKNKGG